MSLGVIYFIVAILTVVMIHEAGHLIAAKAFGFKATKFFVGFGPPLWSFKRGETEYGIAAIPAGGFVKIVGMNPYEEVPEEDRPRSYPNKPAWQRAIVLVAGSATHWVVAFVLLVITMMTIGFPSDQGTNEVALVEERIEGETAPASLAGLRQGDVIVEINGTETPDWDRVSAAIRSTEPGETIDLTVLRNEERIELSAPVGRIARNEDQEIVEYWGPDEVDEPATAPPGGEVVSFLGVQPEAAYDRQGLFEAANTSGGIVVDITARSFMGMEKIFGSVFGGDLWRELTTEGERDPGGAMGLVGAGRIAGESVAEGQFLQFVGLIVTFTIFVGMMNLLPLPPLDGGHLAVLVWEKVTGKKVDVRKLIPIAAAVIAFFLVLFVAVLYLDIARPLESPF
ncbi:MAG TPA: site-2 protease family protein [Actinomycetota bacterium]|nr:site-2 protease family protein [Actinomycetota bacterium]